MIAEISHSILGARVASAFKLVLVVAESLLIWRPQASGVALSLTCSTPSLLTRLPRVSDTVTDSDFLVTGTESRSP